MNRLLVALLATLLTGSTAFAIGGLTQSGHSIVNYAGDSPTDASEQDSPDARLRHARVVASNVERVGEKSLLDVVDPAGGGVINSIPEYGAYPQGRPSSLASFLARRASEADLVVVGRVLAKHSSFADGNRWIYTDYRVQVVEVLKDDAGVARKANEPILVSSPSGTMRIDGREIYALDEASLPLRPGGDEYLLFLKHEPSIDGYRTAAHFGAFRLDKSGVEPMTRDSLAIDAEIPTAPQDWLDILRAR